MMREEPVVYINGRPYVLREASRPFKNLMEYRGIVPARLEQMESRLRVRGWDGRMGDGCLWPGWTVPVKFLGLRRASHPIPCRVLLSSCLLSS